MKKSVFLLFALLSLIMAKDSDLNIMTENYPPYNMEKDGKLKGISIELTQEIFKELGLQKSEDDIVLTSWSRAYNSAENRDGYMVLSTTRTKARENKFKWVGPIAKTTIGVIALKSKNYKIKRVQDLNKYRIGAVLDDVGEQLLIEKGIDRKKISAVDGKDSVAFSFNKLEKNQIDLFAYQVDVAAYLAKQEGIDFSKYEIVKVLEEGELYFAFNKNTDNSIIDRWQSALDQIKQDGRFTAIVDKYK